MSHNTLTAVSLWRNVPHVSFVSTEQGMQRQNWRFHDLCEIKRIALQTSRMCNATKKRESNIGAIRCNTINKRTRSRHSRGYIVAHGRVWFFHRAWCFLLTSFMIRGFKGLKLLQTPFWVSLSVVSALWNVQTHDKGTEKVRVKICLVHACVPKSAFVDVFDRPDSNTLKKQTRFFSRKSPSNAIRPRFTITSIAERKALLVFDGGEARMVFLESDLGYICQNSFQSNLPERDGSDGSLWSNLWSRFWAIFPGW